MPNIMDGNQGKRGLVVTPSHSSPVFDQATQMFLDTVMERELPAMHDLSHDEARAMISRMQAEMPLTPDAQVDQYVLPAGPSGKIDICIARPQGGEPMLPIVMYFHGGGWITGDQHTHDRLIREIAIGANVAVCFVEYSRAPEAQFPVQNEECYAALLYLAENAATFGLDADRIAVAGDGTGGTMAAAISIIAKMRRGPKIALQLLFYPATAHLFESVSAKSFEDGPWLTAAAMRHIFDCHFAEDEATQITALPMNASITQLEGLPPAMIITAENDMLRDEGEAFARKLMQAGVPVIATRYIGTIHDFVMLNALADTPPARGAMAQAMSALIDAFKN